MTSLVLALMAGGALAAPAADKITSLPGWPEGTPLPEMYSGYVSFVASQCAVVSNLPFVTTKCVFFIFFGVYQA